MFPKILVVAVTLPLSFTSVCCAQGEKVMLSASLPQSFTITYKVRSRDLSTLKMRVSEAQSEVKMFRYQADHGLLSEQRFRTIKSFLLAHTAEAPKPKEFKLILSSDGKQIVCHISDYNQQRETVGIYSSINNKTYYLEKMNNKTPQLSISNGFNYSALTFIPLLAFNSPSLGLFLIRDTVSTAASKTDADKVVFQGKSPYTEDNYGEGLTSIPYMPSDISISTINRQQTVKACESYDDQHTNLQSDWNYTKYSAALGTTLPSQIIHRVFQVYTINSTSEALPKTEYRYDLINDKAEPLAAKYFTLEGWGDADKSVAATDFTTQPPLSFSYDPLTTSIDVADGQERWHRNARVAAQSPYNSGIQPLAVGSALLLASIGWLWIRKNR